MIDSDRTRFAEMLVGLCGYYDRQISEGTTALYWRGLCDFSIDEIELAAASHLRDPDRGRFMPKIADFVQAIEGGMDESAALVWDAILYRRALTDEAATLTIASMGGWAQAIGRQDEASLPFIARDFALRYRAFKRRGALNGLQLTAPGNTLKLVRAP